MRVLANTCLLSRCYSAFTSEAHLEYKARANHSLNPTLLSSRLLILNSGSVVFQVKFGFASKPQGGLARVR